MTMPNDGGLRLMFRQRFPRWMWTPIETSTMLGVADSHYLAPNGVEGWVEYKSTDTLRVTFRPAQPAWLDRRAKLGGRTTIAIRRRPSARKFAGLDELYLVDGAHAVALWRSTLDQVPAVCVGAHGARSWDWKAIEKFLTRDFGTTAVG
jgi:hypothetical protein